jgi:D-sedoheptulose 7-phosphate isomerase
MATARLRLLDHGTPPGSDELATLGAAITMHGRLLGRALSALASDPAPIAAAAAVMAATLENGGKILVAGNGGSAAEAQHLAAELVGRFRLERRPLPALSLTADPAILTAIANDYGYEEVFARQVRAWATAGDVLVLFSTSGASPNVLAAARVARECGARTIALCGTSDSPLAAAADLAIAVAASDTPLIQEVHTVVVHLLCDLVERQIAEGA